MYGRGRAHLDDCSRNETGQTLTEIANAVIECRLRFTR